MIFYDRKGKVRHDLVNEFLKDEEKEYPYSYDSAENRKQAFFFFNLLRKNSLNPKTLNLFSGWYYEASSRGLQVRNVPAR